MVLEGQVTPKRLPSPRTILGWDGTDFFALKVDSKGRLIVRGEDQLFSMNQVLGLSINAVISGADGYISSGTVALGRYWVVTTVVAFDVTTAVTRITMDTVHDGVRCEIHAEERAFGLVERACWSGHTYLDKDDEIRAYFQGGLAGDQVRLRITGYQMDYET